MIEKKAIKVYVITDEVIDGEVVAVYSKVPEWLLNFNKKKNWYTIHEITLDKDILDKNGHIELLNEK